MEEQKPAEAAVAVVAKESHALSINSPDEVMSFAKTLKKFIADNNLITRIQDKDYVQVDGWKFAGINFGIVPIVKAPTKDTTDPLFYSFYKKKSYKDKRTNQWKEYEAAVLVVNAVVAEAIKANPDWTKVYTKCEIVPAYKFSCECDLVRANDGTKVGFGSAICSNAELKKVDFDEYAVNSMAQTRAIAKAFRNLLGFIMNAAGFENTPAEEMEEKYAATTADKAEEKQEDVYATIAESLTLITDRVGLVKYFEQADMKPYQSDKKVLELFTKRRLAIEEAEKKVKK